MSIDVAGWLGGTKVLSGGTVTDALGEGGWDWDVDLHPVSTRISKGGVDIKRKVEDHFAVVRMSDYKPLSIVGNWYRPIQHREAFGVIDVLVADGIVNIEAGQSVKDGRKVVLVTKAEDFEIAGEPYNELHAWFNGHDGKTSVMCVPVPTRVFCTNAMPGLMQAAKKDAGAYKLKHTKMAPVKLLQQQQEIFGVNGMDAELREMERTEKALRTDANRAMRRATNYRNNLQQIGEELASVKFSDRDFERFLKKLVPIDEDDKSARRVTIREEKRMEIRLVYKQADDLNNIRGTAWGAFNAVTYYTDHIRNHRGGPDAKLMSIIEGKNDNQRALALLS